MGPVEFGRDDLRRYMVRGVFSGTTHSIAVQMLESIGEWVRAYHVIDPAGGDPVVSFTCDYANLLDRLDRLAEIGGERLAVTGLTILFEPVAGDDTGFAMWGAGKRKAT